MAITALGYIGIRSDRLSEWSVFASRLLAMQQVDQSRDTLAFRMDDHKQRLLISNESGRTLQCMGWEVESSLDLQHLGEQLENAGTRVQHGSRSFCDQRFVEELIYFDDPDGNRLELFHQPMKDNTPFKPGRPISGFNTGPYGMGHVVLHVQNTDSLLTFYRDLLGFKVSDYGLEPYPLYFLHVNGRHHSFAMVGSGKSGLHHFMVEFTNLDDVGQGYDLAQLEENRVAYTLGRHSNDYMTSFYANTPSGFFVESGWGGRIINTDTWEPHETIYGPSYWGHERLYLEPGPRKKMRELRLKAAAEGQRTPHIVDCPWLYSRAHLNWHDSE